MFLFDPTGGGPKIAFTNTTTSVRLDLGTTSYQVPTNFTTIQFKVNGAGGGGSWWGSRHSTIYTDGEDGGFSSIVNLGIEGQGGKGSATGTAGTGVGGDTNTTGTGGTGGSPTGTGGATAVGGKGGTAIKTYTPATLTPGMILTVVVGKGGRGGQEISGNGFSAINTGGDGWIDVIITATVALYDFASVNFNEGQLNNLTKTNLPNGSLNAALTTYSGAANTELWLNGTATTSATVSAFATTASSRSGKYYVEFNNNFLNVERMGFVDEENVWRVWMEPQGAYLKRNIGSGDQVIYGNGSVNASNGNHSLHIDTGAQIILIKSANGTWTYAGAQGSGVSYGWTGSLKAAVQIGPLTSGTSAWNAYIAVMLNSTTQVYAPNSGYSRWD